MTGGYFEFIKLDSAGEEIGALIFVNTVTGLLLQVHPKCKIADVKHLAEIARKTPNYPVDITAWRGPENERTLEWSARIYWRLENYGK